MEQGVIKQVQKENKILKKPQEENREQTQNLEDKKKVLKSITSKSEDWKKGLHSFLDAMLTHLQEHVRFLMEEGELASIRAGFTAFAGFPNVVGAMDCTHIALIAPPGGTSSTATAITSTALMYRPPAYQQGIFTDLMVKFLGIIHDAPDLSVIWP